MDWATIFVIVVLLVVLRTLWISGPLGLIRLVISLLLLLRACD